jgi:uncharacterized membrane protein
MNASPISPIICMYFLVLLLRNGFTLTRFHYLYSHTVFDVILLFCRHIVVTSIKTIFQFSDIHSKTTSAAKKTSPRIS